MLRPAQLISFGLIVFASTACREPDAAAEHASPVAFRLPERDLIPEGIGFDPHGQKFFISSVYKAKIVEVDADRGVSRDFVSERQHGFFGGVGLVVDLQTRTLWAASAMGDQTRDFRPDEDGRSGVFVFSLDDGGIVAKYLLPNHPEKHLLNDLVLTRDGQLFVTDTTTASLYTLNGDTTELELFLRSNDIAYPNGICLSPDEQVLFVANDHGIGLVSRRDRSVRPLGAPTGVATVGIDGLYFHEGSLLAVQNHKGLNRVARFFLSPDLTAITRLDVLLEDHPLFDIPTTGAVVGDELFVIANSQLASYDEERRLFPVHELAEPAVVRVPLNR